MDREKKLLDLEKRLKPLLENNCPYARAFGFRTEIKNGEEIGIPHHVEVENWDRTNLDEFEKKVLKLEKAKQELDEEERIEEPLFNRRRRYRRIDHLLLEGLAEKEEGRPEKLNEYLKLREQVKKDIPKK